jgi:hypothetical protein
MTNFELGQIIARAWSDQIFRSRLLANPSEAVKECNIELPEGTNLRVHANSGSELHIVIPVPPNELELSGTKCIEDDGGCWLPCRGNNSW